MANAKAKLPKRFCKCLLKDGVTETTIVVRTNDNATASAHAHKNYSIMCVLDVLTEVEMMNRSHHRKPSLYSSKALHA